ncbi:hypothetical protein D3C80_1711620 [compost metagenome]
MSGGEIAQRRLEQRNFFIDNFGEVSTDGLLIDHQLPVPADKFPAPYVVIVGETLFQGRFQRVDRETVDTLNTRQRLAQPLADNQAVAHRIAKRAQLFGTGLAQPGWQALADDAVLVGLFCRERVCCRDVLTVAGFHGACLLYD